MVRPIVMPKLGQSEEEATLVQWLRKEGDGIAKGEVLFEIETDKALLEVESFFDGTLLKIVVPEGQTVPVQSIVGFIGDPGEAVPEVPPSVIERAQAPGAPTETPRQPPRAPAAAEAKARTERAVPGRRETQPGETTPPPPTGVVEPRLLRISPRAARLAKESVVDSTPIVGTGTGGRVVERDVKCYLEAQGYDRIRITPAAKKLAAKEKIDILRLKAGDGSGRITVADVKTAIAERPKPMTRMRRVIAQRLAQSYTSKPHFFVTVSADLTELEAFRSELKTQGVSYTITDFILKATALALQDFPTMNSTADGENIGWHSRINLGLAVAMEQGLVVPVIREADVLTLAEIHDLATELTAKARAGKLTPAEMTGSTFTISNMGMLDVENFTAIISPGESAILAVSSTVKQPVVRDDQVVVRFIMKMTLSSDHRIIDGALAARFVNAIRKKLEETSLWKRLA
jgi:pyruvate dehydrogenase E2 component (dihydrolipoyllysine-residue acetyltransferase)